MTGVWPKLLPDIEKEDHCALVVFTDLRRNKVNKSNSEQIINFGTEYFKTHGNTRASWNIPAAPLSGCCLPCPVSVCSTLRIKPYLHARGWSLPSCLR
jgi:hypothetical protein